MNKDPGLGVFVQTGAYQPMSLANIQGLLLDMDGVLWRADQPIGDLPAIFRVLGLRNFRYVFVTNNSTRTPQDYVQKLGKFGVAVAPEEIFTSAMATALMLSTLFPKGGPIHIVGERGLEEALNQKGFWHAEQDALAVVVGLDTNVTYKKISAAVRLIHRGARFIGTNPDVSLPTPEGPKPGAGSLLAAIQTAAGVSPHIVGKPQPTLFLEAALRLGCPPENCLVVGDRYETDILGGHAAGCPTALVLSGVTSNFPENLEPIPDIIASDLTELITKL